jgi:hypothetical protein
LRGTTCSYASDALDSKGTLCEHAAQPLVARMPRLPRRPRFCRDRSPCAASGRAPASLHSEAAGPRMPADWEGAPQNFCSNCTTVVRFCQASGCFYEQNDALCGVTHFRTLSVKADGSGNASIRESVQCSPGMHHPYRSTVGRQERAALLSIRSAARRRDQPAGRR